MLAIFHLLTTLVADLFKSRRRLEVENLFLRHQLHSALMLAAFMIGHHFATSALCSAPSISGVC